MISLVVFIAVGIILRILSLFYEIELAEDFEVAEDDDIYSFSISCNKTTLLCC